MMRSLYSGVSGLRTHQTRMDVIGNNIANVNTTAFKSKQMNFSDMLYQTTQAATGANAANGTGGTNPRQIGLGVKTAAVNTTITQEGANQSTGNPFDLKLTGEAFFVVSDGTSTFYTRDGSFDVDDAGNLCMASTGYIVKGWGVNQAGEIVKGNLTNINVTSLDTYNAAGTTEAKINGIVDSNDSDLENRDGGGTKVTVPIYDKAGYAYNLQFGILPSLNPAATTTRTTLNTETLYAMPEHIYEADISKLTFKYTGQNTSGDEVEKTLSELISPDFMDMLKQDLWAYALRGANITGADGDAFAGTHEFGKADSNVTINLKNYIDGKDLSDDVNIGSELNNMTLTVAFSGETGFVADRTVKYPVSSGLTIDNKIVTMLYELEQTGGVQAGGTSASFTSYTIKTTANGITGTNGTVGTASILATSQVYTDEKGESVTEWKFEAVGQDGAKAAITVSSEQYDIMNRLLTLGKDDVAPKNQFSSVQDMPDRNSVQPGTFTIKLIGMTDSNGNNVDISPIQDDTEYTIQYDTGNGDFQYVGSAGNNSFNVNLSMLNSRGNFENLTVDMSGTSNTDNENKSSLTGNKLDGRKVGTRTGVTVGTDGIVKALYSNGMSRNIGQLCVATFANAMGLENAGDNLYQVTASSGDVNIVDIKASGTGVITSGVLEMSNVDLSQEFTSMITTQRGFQANSRIITTSDAMLEELVNLKR